MPTGTEILAATGDIGGAMALLPVLCELRRRKIDFSLSDHGVISGKGGHDWKKLSEEDSFTSIASGKTGLLIFSTSVKDAFPLKLARFARSKAVKVFCLLDNWMNYRLRMEIDGGDFFIPDSFLVMDEYAKSEAVKDGFPKDRVMVTGQPALASLKEEYLKWKKDTPSEGKKTDNHKKKIVFISEPVESDQGGSLKENLNFRGYTEKTVMGLLLRELRNRSSDFSLQIAPHPRENLKKLKELWNENASGIDGGVLENIRGRDAVFNCDGAAGMASILLYEAYLIGKPAISIQPGLRNPQNSYMKDKSGMSFTCGTEKEATVKITEWLASAGKPGQGILNPELERHSKAPETIADMIENNLRSSM